MANPVRVLFVHNSVLIGGGNRVLLGLFEKLNRKRFEPWSLLPVEGPMETELRDREVPYIVEDVLTCVTTGSRLSQFAAAAAYAWKTSNKRFRILHAQSPLSYRVPSLVSKLSCAKRICHLHFPAEKLDGELGYTFRVEPHFVIACSESVAQSYRPLLEASYPRVPLRVLVNFADTKRFSPGPPPPALIGELGIGGKGPIITLCGQVSVRKGHADLLKAARLVLAKLPSAVFLIVGEDILLRGEYERRMKSMAEELGIAASVKFLGFRSDVHDVLRATDLVVLPSYAEGMPLSLIEASACAKPIVAYNIPGVDEVIEDGRTGRWVPVGDVDALARVICELTAAPELLKAMGTQGRRRVEEQFTLEAYTQRLEQMYEEILTARPANRAAQAPS